MSGGMDIWAQSKPPKPEDDIEHVRHERDGWKRQAETAMKVLDFNDKTYGACALQNRELRRALEEFRNDTPDAWMLVEKALALTPTQSEKIVAAMEALASAVEAGLPSEFGDWARVELDLVRDRLAALDATRKGDA